MLTPTIFYKQIPNWVAKPDSYQRDGKGMSNICYVHFDGKRAVATTAGKAIVVKDWPTEPHMETAEGQRVETNGTFPNIDNVMLDIKDASWKFGWPNSSDSINHLCKEWKQAFTFLRNIKKRPKETIYSVTLQKKGNRLYAYAANNQTAAKILLLENENIIGEDWIQSFDAVGLFQVLEFLLATNPHDLRIYGSAKSKYRIIHFETEDLFMLLAGTNMRKDGTDDWTSNHLKFVNEENGISEEPPESKDDFLN